MVEVAMAPRKLRVIMSNPKHTFKVWETKFEVDINYVPVRPLGRGSYGVVCSCLNTNTNEQIAIKKINDVFDNNVNALRTLRELVILRNIRHDNIIQLKDVMFSSSRYTFKDIYLVYEYMDTDLDQIIKSPQPISNDHCKFFMFQLLRGLKYLHSANVLHRDLKPANLLVNVNCDLKICDFGLSRTTKGEGEFMTEYVVTRWYRAPELLVSSKNYGASIDVWSVGCILAEILGREPLFPGTNSINQLQRIIDVLGKPCDSEIEFIENPRAINFIKSLPQSSRAVSFADIYPHADPLAVDLLQKLLVFDPHKRITITQALKHPYLFDLYVTELDHTAQETLNIEIDSDVRESKLRNLMWGEMLCYRS